MHMFFHMCLSSYENKYVLRETITNVLEREVVELGSLDGIHFGIHIYKVFTQTCTQFRILEGSLIRWNLVHLRGSQ
jgi:hypothetical protein